MRLDAFLAKAAQMSRADAKQALRRGRVTVDRQVCRDGARHVEETAAVALDGAPLGVKQYVYIMLDKPTGVVSASRDARDTTVADLVREAYPRRELFPAGRLDKDSTGFVLLRTTARWPTPSSRRAATWPRPTLWRSTRP